MNIPKIKPVKGMTLADYLGKPKISFSDFVKQYKEKERDHYFSERELKREALKKKGLIK